MGRALEFTQPVDGIAFNKFSLGILLPMLCQAWQWV